jgi:hypothetical protein
MQNRIEVATAFLQRVSDPGYRLNGENPSTATVEQARRWVVTYENLISYKRGLLDLCLRCKDQSEPEVAQAIREADMILLEGQISSFQQKRDYWTIRATELAGNGRRGGSN